MTEPQRAFPTKSSSTVAGSTFDEAFVNAPDSEKEVAVDSDKSSYGYYDSDEKPLYINGEPVITSGRDVSRYLIDVRDDEDPPFTFRSVVLGTVIGGLGAALYQVCMRKSYIPLDLYIFEHSLVDLCVQACPKSDLDSFPTPCHLLLWDSLGNLLPEALSYRGNAVRVARSHSPLYQPWKIQA